MQLKITSYNIQYGVGQDSTYDLTRIVAALEGQDVICLQEVTTNWRECNCDNQPQLLATQLNLFTAYAPAFEVDASTRDSNGLVNNIRRGFGNMVLSRWPILYSRPHSLPRPYVHVPEEFHPRVELPRVALETVIDVDGIPLRFISVHLSHLPGKQRIGQIEKLKRLVNTLPEESQLWDSDQRIATWSEGRVAPPLAISSLILGDFNFEPDSTDYDLMLTKNKEHSIGLVDSWTVSDSRGSIETTSVENDGSLSRLDYMFATENLGQKIRSARVDHCTTASDHFPLRLVLEL
jgi:endonuclease/exonuclease/phosphatase family metal-dependent hydrolase